MNIMNVPINTDKKADDYLALVEASNDEIRQLPQTARNVIQSSLLGYAAQIQRETIAALRENPELLNELS